MWQKFPKSTESSTPVVNKDRFDSVNYFVLNQREDELGSSSSEEDKFTIQHELRGKQLELLENNTHRGETYRMTSRFDSYREAASGSAYRPHKRNVNWHPYGSSGEINDMYWNDPTSYNASTLITPLPPPPNPPNMNSIARTSFNRRQHLPNCPCEHEAYDHQHHQHQHQQSTPQRHHQHPQHFHQNQQYRQQHDRSPLDQRQHAYDKDLFESKKRIRNMRIILGVVLTVIIIGLVSSAVVFLVDSDESNSAALLALPNGSGIQLEDVLTFKLQARRFNGSWSSGSNIIFKEISNITEYDVVTGKHSVLMQDENQQYMSYEKSADGKYLLLARNHVKIFRHSFEALYEILDLQTRQIHPLTIKGSHKHLLFAMWSSVENGLVINFERNLYYKSSALAEEIPLTNDENPAYLNGIPDWVYEEEVFSSNTAVWFNANGTRLAFIRFDDTPTRVIKIPIYGEAGDLRFQYPFNRPVAYPKAGSPNPNVQLFTVDLLRAERNSEFLTEIPRPSPLNTETDYIITVVEWLDNDNVLSVWMNRVQNLAYLQVFDGLRRHEIYHLESKTGWVDLFTEPFKNRDGSQIALILPQLQGDDGYFRHLCLLSTKSAYGSPIAITKGRFVVQSVLHWDPLRNIIFFTANMEDQSHVLHVYALKAVAGTDQQPQCLTCKLQMSGDVEQSYYTADFNTGSQIVISSTGPSIPMHIVYEWSYANNKVLLRKLIDWETNDELRKVLSKFALPQTEIHTIPIADGLTAKVLLQLPSNLDRSGKTKYPMLVDVYGGPDSYSVVDKWTLDWGTYLTSNQSVIYAKIDGRGSGLRGDKLLHSIYLKLGTVEIIDQIEVTRSLQRKLPFIDAEHTGIWGWSYGGYAAAMALANDNSDVFQCAASIAPVTDWAYYDSIYTERYMGLPQQNRQGYENGRLSTLAAKFKGKKFLLIHGTLDDNVHYQQAMILAKNLERNDILFKQISYPDEDHGLAGVRPHLYHSLDKFFGECFGIKRLNKWGRK